jgi:membrane protease subunit HflC
MPAHLARPLQRIGPRARALLLIGATVLVAWVLAGAFFTVDITEHGLVTRFGRIVRVLSGPGLYLKAPFDQVRRLDKRLLSSRLAPAEYLTVDKKNIVIESLVTWRIAEPARFLEALATRATAEPQLADLVLAQVGSVVGKYPAAALISTPHEAAAYRRIAGEIHDGAARFAGAAFGIEVVDVDILAISLPEQNKVHVFDRMTAERGKMAMELRSSGEREARKIIAAADREKVRIEAGAYAEARGLRAEGDAQAARIYTAAFGRNPRFYKFLRTLQAYEKFLDKNTTLFLPADAEVFVLLQPNLGVAGEAGLPRSGARALASGGRRTAPPAATNPGAAETSQARVEPAQ